MDNTWSTDSIDIVLGHKVRRLRILDNISQDTLAKYLGISFQQVQKYERAENRISASRFLEI